MVINIYINDKFYKTMNIPGDNYDPKFVLPQIKADRESGLLNDFGATEKLGIRIEKV